MSLGDVYFSFYARLCLCTMTTLSIKKICLNKEYIEQKIKCKELLILCDVWERHIEISLYCAFFFLALIIFFLTCLMMTVGFNPFLYRRQQKMSPLEKVVICHQSSENR